jgi:hypothetical protein
MINTFLNHDRTEVKDETMTAKKYEATINNFYKTYPTYLINRFKRGYGKLFEDILEYGNQVEELEESLNKLFSYCWNDKITDKELENAQKEVKEILMNLKKLWKTKHNKPFDEKGYLFLSGICNANGPKEIKTAIKKNVISNHLRNSISRQIAQDHLIVSESEEIDLEESNRDSLSFLRGLSINEKDLQILLGQGDLIRTYTGTVIKSNKNKEANVQTTISPVALPVDNSYRDTVNSRLGGASNGNLMSCTYDLTTASSYSIKYKKEEEKSIILLINKRNSEKFIDPLTSDTPCRGLNGSVVRSVKPFSDWEDGEVDESVMYGEVIFPSIEPDEIQGYFTKNDEGKYVFHKNPQYADIFKSAPELKDGATLTEDKVKEIISPTEEWQKKRMEYKIDEMRMLMGFIRTIRKDSEPGLFQKLKEDFIKKSKLKYIVLKNWKLEEGKTNADLFDEFVIDPIDKCDNQEERSEERRVGKECTLRCRSRWAPYH